MAERKAKHSLHEDEKRQWFSCGGYIMKKFDYGFEKRGDDGMLIT